MSVIEELRQNDPDNTVIWIRLRDEPREADLAQALEQNPFVTDIELGLGRGAESRMEFIAACDCDACHT